MFFLLYPPNLFDEPAPKKTITTVTNRNGKARVFTYDENYQSSRVGKVLLLPTSLIKKVKLIPALSITAGIK